MNSKIKFESTQFAFRKKSLGVLSTFVLHGGLMRQKVYLALEISDDMFVGVYEIYRESISVDGVRCYIHSGQALPIFDWAPNRPIITALRQKHNIRLGPFSERKQLPKLELGDSVIIMKVEGLPSLGVNSEYSAEQVYNAKFGFTSYLCTRNHPAAPPAM